MAIIRAEAVTESIVARPGTQGHQPGDAAVSAREDVEDIVPIDARGVPCVLYRPSGATGGRMIASRASTSGHVVYIHGGGFSTFDRDGHDRAARRLANRSGLAVLSVDYRLAPQHRFPAQLDDVATVLEWLDDEGAQNGLDGPEFLQGDSAGGNLALVTALKNPGRFRSLVLIYPFLDPSTGFDSYHTAVPGQGPSDAAVYWDQYVRSPEDRNNPDVAPLLSPELHTLPPTLVLTCEIDMMRDEGERLAELLAQAGVEVVAARWLRVAHSFWKEPHATPTIEAVTRQVADYYMLHS